MEIKRFWRLKWVIACATLLMFSCRSNRTFLDGTIDGNLTTKAIVRNHYANEPNFKTLSGRLKIDYSNGDSSQGVNVALRMEKDKAIWISAPLGMVKALITPDRVTFYNKLENEYFDGDFSYLSNMLGTDLDFQKVQNVLLGQALFDLRDEKHEKEISQNNYQLKPSKTDESLKTSYQIEPKYFKLAALILAQPLTNRILEIHYKNYQDHNKRITPGEITINAVNGDSQSQIAIEYKSVEFNKPISFPYSIPKGFKEISLK